MLHIQKRFLFKDTETVVSITNENEFLLIELNDTIFYPGGGGQPCDSGIIISPEFSGDVVDMIKKENKILHKVKPRYGNLKVGDNVELEINKEKRDTLVKMHTGEHILFKSLEIVFGDIELNKIDLDTNESSLFINTKNVDWDGLFKAEEIVNKIISEDRLIIEKEYPREEAIALGKLRIKPDRIKSDTIRVVEIEDFDWSACAGTHAKTTGYVKNILITKFNLNKGKWEIRFKTDVNEELFMHSKLLRKLSEQTGTDITRISDAIYALQNNYDNYKEKFRNLSAKLLEHSTEEKIGDINLIYNIVEDLEKKQLTDKTNELMKENTIILFINKIDERATVFLSIHPSLNINAPELLNNILSKFDGKGGGRDTFASGSISSEKIDAFLKLFKNELLTK